MRFLDRAGLRIVEARPAGAALEFLLRFEQRLPATRAREHTGALFIVQRAASRPFGAVLAHDMILLGIKDFPPLGIGMGDWIGLHIHGSAPLSRRGYSHCALILPSFTT